MNNTHPENSLPGGNGTFADTMKSLTEEGIKDAMYDSNCYKLLADRIPDEKDKKLIMGIKADAGKHKNLLEGIYSSITGETPPEFNIPAAELPEDLCDAIAEKIFDETDSLDFYTRLLSNLTDAGLRDILIEIIADESVHADYLNYLFAKYNSLR